MNELRKRRIKTVIKYTWPFYIIIAILVGLGMNFIFGVTHRIPSYQSITLFVSGEMKDLKGLKNDLLEKYQDNQLKQVTCISALPTSSEYQAKLTVPGYNTADILIIPLSRLENINLTPVALELSDELINERYAGYSLYQQEETKYGIKIDKEKINSYFTLPDEDCYMVLNGMSVNTGKYSSKEIAEYDNALRIVKDWGI